MKTSVFKHAKLSVKKIAEYLRLDKSFVEEALKEHNLICNYPATILILIATDSQISNYQR